MKLVSDKRIVPALMFHSVGLQNHPWQWPELSEPIAVFERKMALLRRERFHTIFWDDLYAYMGGARSLPANSLMLTFDDGYLDNWVHVFPILKKYGVRATIFVNPDFVDPAAEPRPTLEDVWAGRCRPQELTAAGFLSWAEMRLMEASGLVDIQSHSLTHTWYFSGPRLLDFHRPGLSPYPWLLWNARPERKPFYLAEDQSGFLPFGAPVLEHEKSLLCRRFFADPEALRVYADYAQAQGGAEFFRQPRWRRRLEEHGRAVLRGAVTGEYETDEARRERIRHELAESKRLIEQALGKRVDYICWPGGGNDLQVQALAAEAGYKAWTLGSADASRKRNLPGASPVSIKRLGTSNRIRLGERCIGVGGPAYQLMRIRAHRHSAWSALLLRAYKAAALMRLAGQP